MKWIFYSTVVLQAVTHDICVNGETLIESSRDSETRYGVIKKYIRALQHPPSILDIDAAQGWFSFRIGHDFPGTKSLLVENRQPHLIECLIRLNDRIPNMRLLSQAHSLSFFKELATKEHYDIVLALNVLQYVEGDKQEWIECLRALGDHVFIENPIWVRRAVYKACKNHPKATYLGAMPKYKDFRRFICHSLFHIEGIKNPTPARE